MSNRPDVLETLQQLIRISSVNPMGRDVAGEPYFENRLTDYLQAYFEQLGVPWHRQQVAPQRHNMVALLAGDDTQSTLVFEAHQDTVPADGMTIDPWTPRECDGRIYGRGACDVKGPMACMLTAFSRLARQRPAGMPNVAMACTVNEEHGFTGAQALAKLWRTAGDPLLESLPQAMIVAEPTSLDVVVAHKGVLRWRCHTRGRAAHSSCPTQGANAIYRMAPVIAACEQYAQLLGRQSPHPLLGSPTFSLGTIHGGLCVNAVPDRCTVELDRRLLPHEAPSAAYRDALAWLEQHVPGALAQQLDHDPPFLSSPGLEQSEQAWAEQVTRVARESGLAARRLGVPYATDAPWFAQLGVPTVVLGPGSIDQAHTADEWIAIDQLHLAVEVYYALAAAGLR